MIKSCEYSIDNGCIEISFSDGRTMSILCNEIENTFDLTPVMRSQYDWLIYNDPLTFAELLLSDKLESYLKEYANDYHEQQRNIQEQLEKHYPEGQAEEITREMMRYDS